LFIKIKAEDQSIAIYVFTLVTVVFLPLSFATSYMGMNTSDIRDMEQGQWIFWAVGGVLTVVVMLSVWAIAYRGPRWKKVRQSRKLLHMD
jgi:Mg2+ and Co2+ transporter CorA